VNISIKILHSSIQHKVLLKFAKNYYIWLKHLKDTSKNMHWPSFFWTTRYIRDDSTCSYAGYAAWNINCHMN